MRPSSCATLAEDRLPSLFTQMGPRIDLEETDDAIVVSAEMPGLEKKDFRVEVTGQRLVLFPSEQSREL